MWQTAFHLVPQLLWETLRYLAPVEGLASLSGYEVDPESVQTEEKLVARLQTRTSFNLLHQFCEELFGELNMHQVYAGAGRLHCFPSFSHLFSLLAQRSVLHLGFGQDEEATSRSPAWRWWAVGTADMKWFEHDWTNDA